MFKTLVSLAAMLIGFQASAIDLTSIASVQRFAAQETVRVLGLDLKKGDQADYTLDISFLKGSMSMTVEDVVNDGVWISQKVDLQIQKQEAKILIDPNTGEIKKIIVDGREQQLPEPSDISIIDQHTETITVPAFPQGLETIYVKVKDNKTGEESEAWVNLEKVPVFGLAKSIQPSQLGPINIEVKKVVKK